MKVRLHSQVHEWRERDDEGVLHFIRAEWNAREWEFFTTTKADPDWYPIEKPSLENYESLRDVLWRKYQRKRLSWKFITDLDEKLDLMRGKAPSKEDS